MFPNKKLIYLCGANDGRYANTEGYHRAERRVQWRTARSSRYGWREEQECEQMMQCEAFGMRNRISFVLQCDMDFFSCAPGCWLDLTWTIDMKLGIHAGLVLGMSLRCKICWFVICLWWGGGRGLGLGPSIMQMKEITACLLPSHSYKVPALFVGSLCSIIRPNPKISFK